MGAMLLNYDVAIQPSLNEGFVFDRGKVLLRTFHDGEGNNMVISNVRWEYVSGLVLWVIWKARCIKVFQGVAQSPAETKKGNLVRTITYIMGTVGYYAWFVT